jgi:hypothetical protein
MKRRSADSNGISPASCASVDTSLSGTQSIKPVLFAKKKGIAGNILSIAKN